MQAKSSRTTSKALDVQVVEACTGMAWYSSSAALQMSAICVHMSIEPFYSFWTHRRS